MPFVCTVQTNRAADVQTLKCIFSANRIENCSNRFCALCTSWRLTIRMSVDYCCYGSLFVTVCVFVIWFDFFFFAKVSLQSSPVECIYIYMWKINQVFILFFYYSTQIEKNRRFNSRVPVIISVLTRVLTYTPTQHTLCLTH